MEQIEARDKRGEMDKRGRCRRRRLLGCRRTAEAAAPPPRDLLDMMLGVSARSSNGGSGDPAAVAEQLTDQLFTFLGAGHETTSSTLNSCLLELGQRPDELARCRGEVDAILGPWSGSGGVGVGDGNGRDGSGSRNAGEGDFDVTPEQVTRLMGSRLGHVLHETMRLHPAIPMVARSVGGGAPRQVGPYRLQPGIQVVIPVMALHRSPAFWDEPARFDPSRWERPLRHPFAFVAFSAGARSCIGRRFAMMEMATCLALVLRHFDVALDGEAASNVRHEETITYLAAGVRLTVSPREA